MAKSLRSKVKRSFRAKKRETGVYAAAEAARLHRLNTKLAKIKVGDLSDEEDSVNGDNKLPADDEDLEMAVEATSSSGHAESASMNVDSTKRISTHGLRGSRREEWRLSKGLAAKPKLKGTNKKGEVTARRRAGRPGRRR